MPQLPEKNTLDYNPDSTIYASKKLATIALERMKNPLEDPDQATLSALDAERRLTDSMGKLTDLAGVFHSVVLRIQNMLASKTEAKRGGSNGDTPKKPKRHKRGATQVIEEEDDGSIVFIRKKEDGSTVIVGKERPPQPPPPPPRKVEAKPPSLIPPPPSSLPPPPFLAKWGPGRVDEQGRHRIKKPKDVPKLGRHKVVLDELNEVLSPRSGKTPKTPGTIESSRLQELLGLIASQPDEDTVYSSPAGSTARSLPAVETVYSSPAGSTVAPSEWTMRQNRLLNDADSFREFYPGNDDVPEAVRQRRLMSDADSFREFYPEDNMNSEAISQHRGKHVGFDDMSEISDGTFGDDPSQSMMPSAMSGAKYDDPRNWASLIFYLITVTRRMNMVATSSIRPAMTKLTQAQVKDLMNIFLMVKNSAKDVTDPFTRRKVNPVTGAKANDEPLTVKYIDPFTGVVRNRTNMDEHYGRGGWAEARTRLMELNQYGDEIMNTFMTARNELMLTLTVIINSWKQNTPTGQQTEMSGNMERDFQREAMRNKVIYEGHAQRVFQDKLDALQDEAQSEGNMEGAGRRRGSRQKKDTRTQTMIGCGRNFYGEKINDSRDIPTIWQQYRNCPTKYLL